MMIVKIGGGKDINLNGTISDLSELNESFIIVHGANALRDEIAEGLGKPKKVLTSVKGYSSVYSDEEAVNVMMMAYAGLRNKRLVELCQQYGLNAIGLSGLDGRMIQGWRNPGIRVREGNKIKIVRDYSGKPRFVNVHLLNLLFSNGFVPVLSVPILDEHNIAINSENDDIVMVLQRAVNADTIILLIEAQGLLDKANDPDSVIKILTADELAQRQAQVEGRMKRKILALCKLFENGACQVIISDGRTENPIKDALAGRGTTIS